MNDIKRINAAVVLEAMQKKARELDLTRGAVVFCSPLCVDQLYNEAPIGWGYYRSPDPISRGPEDAGTNYIAFAMGKIFMALRTGKPSTREGAMRGESPARGCVVSKDGRGFFACSGGTEDEDVLVAYAGKEVYDRLMAQ